ncbi:LysR family transcriptional regulator [Macromonas nakdongensis]|jgi:DNA-binding transcriptional LysR family regulator|uniref:LysR family transcriptional regulator n=1 Tax=Macromonas nakdongensis TaxID=1843082 RepID=UPI000C34D115|nr:LysR family transcriptional regulator [Macromonas nakdongensis]
MSFHLDDLALFARVSALGTLSAAARERNIPVSQVTRALNRLEAACGARLMHRTTHGLSLTDEGDTLLQHGSLMLDTSEVLKADLRGRQNEPSGWVRVGVSASVAESLIAPSLPALYEKYPRLHIEVLADDRLADMARDGIDIAIRTAAVHSETLVARQIGSASRTLYASPSYLAKNGTPQHPDELAQHHMIGNSRAISMNLWERQDAKSGLQIKGQTLTDNSAVLLSMVRHGVGIARLLDIVASPLVKSGELVPLLRPYFDVQEIPVYAVMLQERHRLPKIRACVEFWAEYLAGNAFAV